MLSSESSPAVVDHDLHVHTTLSSCCGDPECTAGKLLRRAEVLGLRTIGFADHMWDNPACPPSDWYAPQTYEHIARVRDDIAATGSPVRALVGCESDFFGPDNIGITPEVAARLDFVLLPCSHLHMEHAFGKSSRRRPAETARLLTDLFAGAVAAGVATGIPHPFVPCGRWERQTDEIIACISDEQFADLFGRAAERGISIEVHPGHFLPGHDDDTARRRRETFFRVLTIARDAGCRFHFASDAHQLIELDKVTRLAPYAAQLALTADHILPLARGAAT